MNIKYWDKNKEEYIEDSGLVFIFPANKESEPGVWQDACDSVGACWDLSGKSDIEAHIFVGDEIVARYALEE